MKTNSAPKGTEVVAAAATVALKRLVEQFEAFMKAKMCPELLEWLAAHPETVELTFNQLLAVNFGRALPPQIIKAKEFIAANYKETFDLEDVANVAGLSPFYFCKMFKKVTGDHFTVYVNRVRTENAKVLLLNPNLRVNEVAYECGFQSLTHFNRIFKKFAGVSPTEYREANNVHKGDVMTAAKVLLEQPETDPATVWRQLGFSSYAHFESTFQRATGEPPARYHYKAMMEQ